MSLLLSTMKELKRLHVPKVSYKKKPSRERTPEFAAATGTLFNDIRPTLASFVPDGQYNYFREFKIGEQPVSWLYQDEEGIANKPDASGRWEEKLHVHTPDWHHTAQLHYIKNIFAMGVIRLEEGYGVTSETQRLGGITCADATLTAIAENGRDMLHSRFSSDTDKWYTHIVKNSAPGLVDLSAPDVEERIERIEPVFDYSPTEHDLHQLRVSAKLLAVMIQRIRLLASE